MARGFPKDLVDVVDLTPAQLDALVEVGRAFQRLAHAASVPRFLAGQTVVTVAVDPVVPGDMAMAAALGSAGATLLAIEKDQALTWDDDGVRAAGTMADAMVLGRGLRGRDRQRIRAACPAPVIDLGGAGGPLETMADAMAMVEAASHGTRHLRFRDLAGITVAFVGGRGTALDAQRALAVLGGWDLVQCAPRLEWAEKGDGAGPDGGASPGGTFRHQEGLEGFDTVDYLVLDTWDQPDRPLEKSQRMARFFPDYQMTRERYGTIPGAPWILHRLPLRRGEEVVDVLVDGDRSLVWSQVRALKGAAWALGAALIGPRVATDETTEARDALETVLGSLD